MAEPLDMSDGDIDAELVAVLGDNRASWQDEVRGWMLHAVERGGPIREGDRRVAVLWMERLRRRHAALESMTPLENLSVDEVTA
jgi:hypothetical protein